MSEFREQWRKLQSQQRAAKRIRRSRKRDQWAGKYLGINRDAPKKEGDR